MRNIIKNIRSKRKIKGIYLFTSNLFLKELDDICTMQFEQKYIAEKISKILEYQTKNKNDELIIILDDIVPTRKKQKDEEETDIISKIACQCRHFRINFIYCAQYFSHQLDTIFKSNLDYIFIRMINYKICESLVCCIYGFKNARELYEFIQKNTQDYKFIM
jgi:hypothetical protein